MKFIIFIVNNAVGLYIIQVVVPMRFCIKPVNIFTGVYPFHKACFSKAVKCFIYCAKRNAWVFGFYFIINLLCRRVAFIAKQAGVYYHALLGSFQACACQFFLYLFQAVFALRTDMFLFNNIS